ncbi:unnamed protein product, partial [Meganyctiphanes norvegica]
MLRAAISVVLVTASVSLFLGLILAKASVQDVQNTLEDTLKGLQDTIQVLLQPKKGQEEQETNQDEQADLVDRLQSQTQQDEPLGQPDVVPHEIYSAGSLDDKQG